MFVIFCRVFQFFFNFGAMFFPWRKAIPVEGPGSIGKIPDLLRGQDVKKPLLVTDNGLVKAGVAQRVIAVPTTAGTGSETTIAALITYTQTHHKYACRLFTIKNALANN